MYVGMWVCGYGGMEVGLSEGDGWFDKGERCGARRVMVGSWDKVAKVSFVAWESGVEAALDTGLQMICRRGGVSHLRFSKSTLHPIQTNTHLQQMLSLLSLSK